MGDVALREQHFSSLKGRASHVSKDRIIGLNRDPRRRAAKRFRGNRHRQQRKKYSG